jgi:hypothetical protein
MSDDDDDIPDDLWGMIDALGESRVSYTLQLSSVLLCSSTSSALPQLSSHLLNSRLFNCLLPSPRPPPPYLRLQTQLRSSLTAAQQATKQACPNSFNNSNSSSNSPHGDPSQSCSSNCR